MDGYTAHQSVRLSRCPSRVTYNRDYLGYVFKGESISLSWSHHDPIPIAQIQGHHNIYICIYAIVIKWYMPKYNKQKDSVSSHTCHHSRDWLAGHLWLALSLSHQNKSTYDKEILVIVRAATRWRPYLIGRRFQIKTDHKSLKYFLERKISSPE